MILCNFSEKPSQTALDCPPLINNDYVDEQANIVNSENGIAWWVQLFKILGSRSLGIFFINHKQIPLYSLRSKRSLTGKCYEV